MNVRPRRKEIKMAIRIVVGGQMNSGKSTLIASVYKHLQATGVNVGVHELDVFSDTLPCILGLKPWDQRNKRESGRWQNDAINRRLCEFVADRNLIVLGDLPGLIDGSLEKMVGPAEMAIVVGRSFDGIEEWSEFFRSQKIPTVMRVLSCLDGNTSLPLIGITLARNLNRKILRNKDIFGIVDRISAILRGGEI
jgi:GTPase SAR1 family protein